MVDPRKLAASSCKFSANTVAVNGVHPRHIALLDPAALEFLANVLDFAEALGGLPRCISDVMVALLKKVTGGFRPIGWFQSLFRIWLRARAPLVKLWERECTGGLGFAADKGGSAVDVVWRHACAAEIADVQENHF